MQQTVTSRHGCSDLRLTQRTVANRSPVAFLVATEVQNDKNHNKGATRTVTEQSACYGPFKFRRCCHSGDGGQD